MGFCIERIDQIMAKDGWDMAADHCSRREKNSSRVIPAVLILFLMMNTGTEGQSGITTGLGTPQSVHEMIALRPNERETGLFKKFPESAGGQSGYLRHIMIR